MKSRLILWLTLLLSISIYGQQTDLPDPEPYFSAMIVEDMEQSLNWYTNNLGFKIIKNSDFNNVQFKQANLKRGQILIELIELETALNPIKAIPNYNDKTRTIGIFKIGFMIQEFDTWIAFLKKNKVDFHGTIVMDDITGNRMIIIKDPDGNRIQLFEKLD